MRSTDSLTQESSFDAHQARFVEYWTKRPADELAHALVDSEDEVTRLRALLTELAEERGAAIDDAAVLRAELGGLLVVSVVYEPDPRTPGLVKIGMPGPTRRSHYYKGEAESAAICVALESVKDRVARGELPVGDDFTVRVVFVNEFGERREHGGTDPGKPAVQS